MTKQHLFFLLFFTGSVPCVLSETRKYFLVQQRKTWADAQLYCRAEHADLAIVKSNDDLIQFMSDAKNQNFASSAWIGLYSNMTSWLWSTNNEQVGRFRPWEAGEPNNNGGKQHCGATTPTGWWDLRCTELRSFICFDETKTGSDRYIFISNRIQWHEAQTYCRQYHTDLAIARDANENSVILRKIPEPAWFGLIKDPWKWVDNTDFSIMSWWSGQPNNYFWNENCGYLYISKVSDELCSTIMPFFCYSETAKQQVVKMKIQSKQDVNYPAVIAAILEKIKLKLKEHGMEKDIVVKWRVKKDGVIFEKNGVN